MTTRHLVSLVTGVLILSVLFPIGLSLWLAHRQVEKRFNEELDIFSSRVALRTERVSDQAKAALTLAEKLGVAHMHVTLADERHYACATVILES